MQCVSCDLMNGLWEPALQTIFRAIVVAKLMYGSSAWSRFATATDRQKLKAFIQRSVCTGFYTKFRHGLWLWRTRKCGKCKCMRLEADQCRAGPFPLWLGRRAKFEVAEPIHCRIIAILLLIHYFTLWPWPLTPLPWPMTVNSCRVWPVTWWNSLPNLNAIEQSAAEV